MPDMMIDWLYEYSGTPRSSSVFCAYDNAVAKVYRDEEPYDSWVWEHIRTFLRLYTHE